MRNSNIEPLVGEATVDSVIDGIVDVGEGIATKTFKNYFYRFHYFW